MKIRLVGTHPELQDRLRRDGFIISSEHAPDSLNPAQKVDAIVIVNDGRLDAVARFRGRGFRGGILVLAEGLSAEQRIALLDAGADDVWNAVESLPELAARLRALERRPMGWQDTVLRGGPLTLDLVQRSVTRAGRPLKLTKTEFELLALFMRRPGHALTVGLLSDALGDREMSANTLSAHLRNLRRKIDWSGKGSMIRTRRGMGYIFAPDRNLKRELKRRYD